MALKLAFYHFCEKEKLKKLSYKLIGPFWTKNIQREEMTNVFQEDEWSRGVAEVKKQIKITW